MQAESLRVVAIGLLAAAVAGLAGCASNRTEGGAPNEVASNRRAPALPGTPACFWLMNFDGSWTVLNNSELIVYAPSFSAPYLIKLFEPVPTLKFDQRLGFQDVGHTGMICDGEMDNIIVPHWQPVRIPIVAVRKLTKPEERRLLVANHIKLPARSKPTKGNQVAEP